MDTLQHVAAHCITLHHIASRCNTLQQYLIKFVFGHSAAVVNIELLKSLGKTLHKNSQKSALKSFYMQNLVANQRLQISTIATDVCSTIASRGGGLGSSTIFKKFHETYAPS